MHINNYVHVFVSQVTLGLIYLQCMNVLPALPLVVNRNTVKSLSKRVGEPAVGSSCTHMLPLSPSVIVPGPLDIKTSPSAIRKT